MSGISIADKSGAFASLLGLGLAPNWSKIEIKRIKLSGGAVLIEYVSISSQTEHHIKWRHEFGPTLALCQNFYLLMNLINNQDLFERNVAHA